MPNLWKLGPSFVGQHWCNLHSKYQICPCWLHLPLLFASLCDGNS